jgi:hypothetical protein
MRRSPVPLVFAGIFLPAGIALLATVAPDFLATRAFLARAARTTGIVTKVEKASRLNDVETVAFEADGNLYEFRANPARVPWSVGARVPVAYDPANPREAQIDRYEELWHDIAIRGGMGALLALLGIGMASGWLAAGRRKAPASN